MVDGTIQSNPDNYWDNQLAELSIEEIEDVLYTTWIETWDITWQRSGGKLTEQQLQDFRSRIMAISSEALNAAESNAVIP